jgi:hypothetical protein
VVCRFTLPSSDAVLSPELSERGRSFLRFPPARALVFPPTPPTRPDPPAPFAAVAAPLTLIIFRTACCHRVRMFCVTRGNFTTSTTPTRMASIMYALFPTSSSSCISTMAHWLVSLVNRVPSSRCSFVVVVGGTCACGCACGHTFCVVVPFAASLAFAKNGQLFTACFSSTSATSKGDDAEDDSSAAMPFSNVAAQVTVLVSRVG